MVATNDIIDQWRVPAGKQIRLKDYESTWSGDVSLPKAERKKYAKTVLSQDVSRLARAQDLLYAANRWSVLIILQAMDAAGKDSTIKHVMSGVNPQGCQVYSFKHPSAEELDHTYFGATPKPCRSVVVLAYLIAPILRKSWLFGCTLNSSRLSAFLISRLTTISGLIASLISTLSNDI